MKYIINNVTTDWKAFISDQLSKQDLIKIDKELYESKEKIFPNKDSIFRAFDFFDVADTKLIIFGQDPYATFEVADGLAFSTNKKFIPPSLRNLFKKLDIDLGINRINSDLSDWAKQGVLLLNACLTVVENKPNSHIKLGWSNFIIACIEYLNQNTTNVIFLLLGKNAQNLSQYINNQKHSIICRPHPSPLARNKIFEQDLFVELNNLILKNKFYHMKW